MTPRAGKKPGVPRELRLRVATYNIHKGVTRELFGLRRVTRIHELRARLHELDADLVFLQEVQGRHERHASRVQDWPAESQHTFLGGATTRRHTFESAYGPNAAYLHGHHGNALLSRFPILHRENRDVSDHALEKRGILHCVVQCPQLDLHCFVIHFGLFAASRKRQTEVLVDWIEREIAPGAPLIIAGDFNDWQNRLSSTLYERLGVREVFDQRKPVNGMPQRVAHFVRSRLFEEGAGKEGVSRQVRPARTFPALVPWLRMDRIYLRGFEVSDARVLRGPAWARLSDHSPLLADLQARG
jgi:endonuclease/exonuclease/phosphatase family metal-dependent hydrolase